MPSPGISLAIVGVLTGTELDLDRRHVLTLPDVITVEDVRFLGSHAML